MAKNNVATACAWLEFIRDHTQLDTSSLIARAQQDLVFVASVEAVLATASSPAHAMDALRSYCVNQLMGEPPRLPQPPRVHLQPYTVPYAFIKDVFAAQDRMRTRRYSTNDPHDTNPPPIPYPVHWPFDFQVVKGGQATTQVYPRGAGDNPVLLTSGWIACTPFLPPGVRGLVHVATTHTRYLYEFTLRSFVLPYQQALAIWVTPGESVEVQIANPLEDDLLCAGAFEGWGRVGLH